jgi:DNA-binding GntR family transcriptional regulator
LARVIKLTDKRAGPRLPRRQRRRRSFQSRQDVFEIIRNRISEHQLLPGSRLREHDLAAEFGISRAHIREILSQLEQRGLVVRVPNRGAMVAYLDPEQAINLYFVREALEALAARLAAERAPSGAWDDLTVKLGPSIEARLRKGDYEEYETILAELNRRMVEYARNPILADMIDRILDRTQVMGRRIVVLQGRAELGLELHRRLLQALSAGDAAAAGSVKAKIISTARDYIDRYKDFIF